MFGRRSSSTIGYVGIDFGARFVRMVQVRQHHGELQVVGAGMIDKSAASSGEENSTVESNQIRSAMVSGGFSGRKCVISLPREEVQIQVLSMPRMPDDELKQAVGWEASQRFSFDRAAMEVDFIRTGATIGGSDAREEVLLIAASHAALNACLEPVLDTGMRPVAVDTGFGAIARLFSRQARREADRNQVRAIVDVGGSSSTVIIVRGDQIAFCKTLSVGGDHFTHAVAEHLQMENSASRELRMARIAAASGGSSIDPATERAVFEAVRPLMSELVREVMLCLRHYGVTFRGHPPESLILTGADALEPQLDVMLNQSCKLLPRIDDELETNGNLHDSIQRTLNRNAGPMSAWSTAVGLSLRGIFVARADKKSAPETQARRGAA